MPRTPKFLTVKYRTTGTKFLIFPQRSFGEPELVYVNAAPGTIAAGPQDAGIYVIDAKNKIPYFKSGDWPPYTGYRWEPAYPNPAGHFDDIKPGNPAFPAATVFGTIRCVLDVWEHYLGRRVRWYFRDAYPRLEVIPRVLVRRNAISMFGYVECGYDNPEKRRGPWCQNFDIVAHEVGHVILKDVIGYPEYRTVELRAHEEAAADLAAIVAVLHFPEVVKQVLAKANGDLFSPNELTRLGEFGKSRELRNAFNNKTMSKVRWDSDPDAYRYDLALPFLGAAFDVFVLMYQDYLVRRGAIPKKLALESQNLLMGPNKNLQPAFARRFRRQPGAFTRALLDARDTFARLLVGTWRRTSMHDFAYARVVANMLDTDLELTRGRYRRIIRESFAWREIVPAAGPLR